jgi:hypothetical protein
MKHLFRLVLAAALLAGCAGLQSLTSDVSSFGDWPADRQPGSYAFDRLPSQRVQAADTESLEAAARPALARAGFQPAAEGRPPDVLVQLGARMTQFDRVLWDDPTAWYGGIGYGYWRHGFWPGSAWGWGYPGRYYANRYGREVGLILRDRATGKLLFEAHASNEGSTWPDLAMLTAMFEAALMDFPRLGVNPRQVVVTLPPQ